MLTNSHFWEKKNLPCGGKSWFQQGAGPPPRKAHNSVKGPKGPTDSTSNESGHTDIFLN